MVQEGLWREWKACWRKPDSVELRLLMHFHLQLTKQVIKNLKTYANEKISPVDKRAIRNLKTLNEKVSPVDKRALEILKHSYEKTRKFHLLLNGPLEILKHSTRRFHLLLNGPLEILKCRLTKKFHL